MASAQPQRSCTYRRRTPEDTLLHRLVREHWPALLADVAQRTDGGSFPGFVTSEFERYLRCGILAHGFARVRCASCGDESLVAFSCQTRGVRPSCTTRRMQGTATHLLDRVFPAVPVRQWVLSLPRWAREELRRILVRICRRVRGSLAPLRAAAREDARPLDPLGQAHAASVAAVLGKPADAKVTKRLTAYLDGFSLHAGVHLHANDREGLAHLLGYGARPALSQERLSSLPDGRVALRLKRPLADGRGELLLEPAELLRRLATLVPPPRAHLVRYHGVFAPASKWRREIIALTRPPPEPAAPAQATPSPEQVSQARRAPDSRIPWAELLQRVFREDVLACPCGGRRKLIAFIREREAVRAILEHLGLPCTGPPTNPARLQVDFHDQPWQDDVPAIQLSGL